MFESLSPALSDALTQRGFTALTAVQEAVLDPALADRDLRIASQTGSGKTLAIGFVLSPALEALDPTQRGGPFALLIAPTRELAAQLAKELTWLFESQPIGVAVVAGGASYRDEMYMLRSKPRIVVGTPGRLLDHLNRGSIDPSKVGAVVLDEADQMLDLGFRDELESILAQTPEARRTHLVSATFSREVLSLAQRYQQKAVMVEGTVLGAANHDIAHVAHVVKPHELESAIINLLLMAPGERTLMFVRTRADASDLSEALGKSGFFSLPLSGELEQRERNKTLEAFRSGGVMTLVATDVAARGLDVPDVSRVIHVDPPGDAEGLTHRSGRTGRAGKKGVSIVLVPPAGRERVKTMFRRARIEAAWLPVPGAKEIAKNADDRLFTEMAEQVATAGDDKLASLAKRLLEAHDPQALVTALLSRAGHGGPCDARQVSTVAAEPRQVAPMRGQYERGNDRGPAHGQERGQDRARHAYTPFRITWGENHGADPRRLLAMVCRRGEITGDQVGAIRIGPDDSTFEVSMTSSGNFTRNVKKPDPRNPKVWITPMEMAPSPQAQRRGSGSAWPQPTARSEPQASEGLRPADQRRNGHHERPRVDGLRNVRVEARHDRAL